MISSQLSVTFRNFDSVTPLTYQTKNDFEVLCESLLKWGERNHTYLKREFIKNDGRWYYTLTTTRSWFRGITRVEGCALLIVNLFQKNIELFKEIRKDLAVDLSNQLRVRFKGEPEFCSYFQDLYKETQKITYERIKVLIASIETHEDRIRSTLEKAKKDRSEAVRTLEIAEEVRKREIGRVVGKVSLKIDPTAEKVGFIMRKSTSKCDLQFVCKCNKTVLAHSELFKELDVVALSILNQDSHMHLISLEEFSVDVVDYFVDYHYQIVENNKLPLTFLIQVEALADYLGDEKLLKSCKDGIGKWQMRKEYSLLFVDLLATVPVFPSSEIYEAIPRLHVLKDIERIRSDNLSVIFRSGKLTESEKLSWLIKVSPKE